MENEIKDAELKHAAQKREGFKYHVLIYFIMNVFFWTMWYISLKNNATPEARIHTIPWPVWTMLIWGTVLVIHYSAVNRKRDERRQ